jgi:magnesium transporter
MLSVRLCLDAHGKPCNPSNEDALRKVLATPQTLTWLDVDREDLDQLQPYSDLIHLHHLAVEDAQSTSQRPIVSRYNETVFLVLYELVPPEDTGIVRSFPISFFVGKNYVVTARDIERSTLDDVAKRWREFTGEAQVRTSGFLLYAMIDAIVDGYFPIIDSLGDRLEEAEAATLDPRQIVAHGDIHQIRKELFQVRRVLAPGREVVNELIRRDTPLVDDQTINYFHDVYDHMLRVLDGLDAYREMASTLFEVQLAMSSHRLDQVIRTLTVASIMLMGSSLIAGIYGMNFQNMPELSWQFGYPVALGLMLMCSTMLYVYFHRRGWL